MAVLGHFNISRENTPRGEISKGGIKGGGENGEGNKIAEFGGGRIDRGNSIITSIKFLLIHKGHCFNREN